MRPSIERGGHQLTRRLIAVGLATVLVSCTGAGQAALPDPGTGVPPGPALVASNTQLDAEARRWVDETLAGLTLREAVAQLVIPWIPGGYASESDADFQELLGWVEEGLGGVSISIGVPDAYVAKLNRLQSRARVPLLVTADFENGGPGMRINHSYALPSLLPQGGGTSFPPTMAFGAAGDEDLAFEYGRITAEEARAVGVHWLFAPVLDVNSNPDNPVINTRAFGEDPETVGRLGAAFIRGARAGGALTTAKHFPGHGDTRTDSHIELPVIGADRDRMDRVELLPFRMAVDAGVDAVMTAHVAVPGVLGDDRPATMSPYFMTDVLRGEMGFGGILFTDALRMGAITDGYGAGEAAVVALEAGSDVVLAPDGIGAAVEAVTEAVESGRVSRARVDLSVRRLLEAKARLGLHRSRLVDPATVATRVGTAEHRAVADRAAAASLTLVRDERGALPISPAATVLSVTYARPDDLLAGRTFNSTLATTSRCVSPPRGSAPTRPGPSTIRSCTRPGPVPSTRSSSGPTSPRAPVRAPWACPPPSAPSSLAWAASIARLRRSSPSAIPISSPPSRRRAPTWRPGAGGRCRSGPRPAQSPAPRRSRAACRCRFRPSTARATDSTARRARSSPGEPTPPSTRSRKPDSCRVPERGRAGRMPGRPGPQPRPAALEDGGPPHPSPPVPASPPLAPSPSPRRPIPATPQAATIPPTPPAPPAPPTSPTPSAAKAARSCRPARSTPPGSPSAPTPSPPWTTSSWPPSPIPPPRARPWRSSAAASSCGCAATGASTTTPPRPPSPRPRSSTWPRSPRWSAPPRPPSSSPSAAPSPWTTASPTTSPGGARATPPSHRSPSATSSSTRAACPPSAASSSKCRAASPTRTPSPPSPSTTPRATAPSTPTSAS